MKIRTDFVTNSSSSSFIIDKDKFDGELSVEGVFQKIKELHEEFAGKLKNIKRFLKKRGVIFYDGHFYIGGKDIFYDESGKEIRDELERVFDVDLWWLCEDGSEFAQYPTYQAFCDAATKIDFSIADYRSDKAKIDYYAHEVLSWYTGIYFGCFSSCEDSAVDCGACDETEWCDTLALIVEKRKEYDDDKMTISEIVRKELLKLGGICVHSWEGVIDVNVVRQLKKLCTYSCNHMG